MKNHILFWLSGVGIAAGLFGFILNWGCEPESAQKFVYGTFASLMTLWGLVRLHKRFG